jgi:hypothetical protein
VLGQAVDHGSRLRRLLAVEGEGVGLERQELAVAPDDLVFVELARLEPGDEQLPDADAVAQAHRVGAPVPVVERADHADAPGIGRPHGEGHAGNPLHFAGMRPQPLVQMQMPAFAQEMDVEFAQHLGEAVGVVDDVLPVEAPHAEPVGEALVSPFDGAGKHAVLVQAGQLGAFLAILVEHPDGLGAGQHGPHAQALSAAALHAQHGEGIALQAGRQAFYGFRR